MTAMEHEANGLKYRAILLQLAAGNVLAVSAYTQADVRPVQPRNGTAGTNGTHHANNGVYGLPSAQWNGAHDDRVTPT